MAEAIAQLVDLRSRLEGGERDIVVNGCIGPRGDGYDGTARMSARQSQDYHATQVDTFADTAADMVNAMTITYPEEAIGIVHAAARAELPAQYAELRGALPGLTVLGGCCGTDLSHLRAIAGTLNPSNKDAAPDNGS